MMLNKIKARLTSKTYIAAVTMGVITAIEINSPLLSTLLPPEQRPYLLALWPVIMMTLREITKTSVDEK